MLNKLYGGTMDQKQEVRTVLDTLRDAYLARDLKQLDSILTLFDQDDQIEMIG